MLPTKLSPATEAKLELKRLVLIAFLYRSSCIPAFGEGHEAVVIPSVKVKAYRYLFMIISALLLNKAQIERQILLYRVFKRYWTRFKL